MEELDLIIATVEAYLNITNEVIPKLRHVDSRIQEFHAMELDFNHLIELEDLGYHSLAKATQEHQVNRKKRREYKDQQFYLQLLEELVRDPQFNAMKNKMTSVLGKLIHHRTIIGTRSYAPKSQAFKTITKKENEDE